MASPVTQSADSRGSEAPASDRTFGTAFWLTYAANTAMTAASSLFFRYDDFVEALGGGEFLLGWIIGVGMVGSLLVRTVQGRGIDDYGARRIWLWSAALFVASCLAHLAVSTAHGPLIFICRALLQTSMAGFFGASISYIAGRKATAHMAEVIGTLGTSGFIGIVLGTFIGDLVLGDGKRYELMFVLAAALGSVAIVLGWLAAMENCGRFAGAGCRWFGSYGDIIPARCCGSAWQPVLAWEYRRFSCAPMRVNWASKSWAHSFILTCSWPS